MVNSNRSTAPHSRLKELKTAYKKRLISDFEQLETLKNQLSTDSSNHQLLSELHAALHTMAGTAGTFGFHTLGETAKSFEKQVEQQRASSPNEQNMLALDWLDKLIEARDFDNRKTKQDEETEPQTITEGAPIIWLVERDDMLAHYAQSQLNSFGFEVHCLSDAEQLDNENATSPDLLLIDHHATQFRDSDTNLTSYWQTKLKHIRCPVFFTGAEETFNARLQALRAGGSGYFVKPLDIAKLASKFMLIIETEDADPGRVMIIEDDRELASYCQSVLEQAKMKVEKLHQPEQLFEKVSEFSPELILMDLSLPKVSGAELTALLSQTERWAHLPVIYLSGESNPELRNQALLKGGDAFLEKPIDTKLLVQLCQTRIQKLRELNRSRDRDSLTGLLKHGSIKEALQTQWQLTQRRPQTFSVVMLDIDHFKAVNDTYGHAVGDLVIAAIGTLLRQHFRSTDKLGRYGGEEFTLVLPDCEALQAKDLVNRLREDFAAIKFRGNNTSFSCTISAGITENNQFPTDKAEELLERADKALYRAKNAGRNCVMLAADDSAKNG
ncbi:diguanylate cyclase [Bermanella sp. R86510]|uniref:diguanylate cyclase n=1 Tax=unclassified Bermanella TaxID=2627862 RepID=UPI0037C745DF